MKLTSSSTFNCIIVAAFLLDSRGGEQKWKNDCRDLESRKLNPGKLSRLAEAWQQGCRNTSKSHAIHMGNKYVKWIPNYY